MPQTSSPLLQGQGLPEFGAITCDRVKQDIPVILKQVDEAFTAYERRLEDILGSQTNLDWSTVMGPLQSLGSVFGGVGVLSPISMACAIHPNSAQPTRNSNPMSCGLVIALDKAKFFIQP